MTIQNIDTDFPPLRAKQGPQEQEAKEKQQAQIQAITTILSDTAFERLQVSKIEFDGTQKALIINFLYQIAKLLVEENLNPQIIDNKISEQCALKEEAKTVLKTLANELLKLEDTGEQEDLLVNVAIFTSLNSSARRIQTKLMEKAPDGELDKNAEKANRYTGKLNESGQIETATHLLTNPDSRSTTQIAHQIAVETLIATLVARNECTDPSLDGGVSWNSRANKDKATLLRDSLETRLSTLQPLAN